MLLILIIFSSLIRFGVNAFLYSLVSGITWSCTKISAAESILAYIVYFNPQPYQTPFKTMLQIALENFIMAHIDPYAHIDMRAGIYKCMFFYSFV
jgi:hypothetical protein